jgi:hypothetical protein
VREDILSAIFAERVLMLSGLLETDRSRAHRFLRTLSIAQDFHEPCPHATSATTNQRTGIADGTTGMAGNDGFTL